MERLPPLFTSDISLFLSNIARADFFITYQAIQDEVSVDRMYFLKDLLDQMICFQIPPRAQLHPEKVASKVRMEFHGKAGVVFLPGQKFDATGTRHGRGGGWYDRFLSELPASLLRVGVLPEKYFSSTPLVRRPWDQPVDWLLVQRGENWEVRKTNARANES